MAPRPWTKHPAARTFLFCISPIAASPMSPLICPFPLGCPTSETVKGLCWRHNCGALDPDTVARVWRTTMLWRLRVAKLAAFSSCEFVFLHRKVQTSMKHRSLGLASWLWDAGSVWAANPICLLLAIVGSIREPSTAGAGPTTTTQTSTTSTRGTPSSTKRPSGSTESTRQRSNRTWRGARPCRRPAPLRVLRFDLLLGAIKSTGLDAYWGFFDYFSSPFNSVLGRFSSGWGL